jgi:hypothetical protein
MVDSGDSCLFTVTQALHDWNANLKNFTLSETLSADGAFKTLRLGDDSTRFTLKYPSKGTFTVSLALETGRLSMRPGGSPLISSTGEPADTFSTKPAAVASKRFSEAKEFSVDCLLVGQVDGKLEKSELGSEKIRLYPTTNPNILKAQWFGRRNHRCLVHALKDAGGPLPHDKELEAEFDEMYLVDALTDDGTPKTVRKVPNGSRIVENLQERCRLIPLFVLLGSCSVRASCLFSQQVSWVTPHNASGASRIQAGNSSLLKATALVPSQ